MKNILVPTDFSEAAQSALNLAVQVAKKTNARITLLHAIEPVTSYVAATDGMYIDVSVEKKYIDYLREGTQVRVEELLRDEKYKEVEIKPLVTLSALFAAIHEQEEKSEVDLVIMGTQGTSGLDELLIGSNTEKVVRTSKVPVFTIRKEPDNFEFKKIVFATNFDLKHKPALKTIQKFQELFGAHLYLLCVNVPGNFYTEREILKKKEAFLEGTSLQNYSFHVYHELNEENGVIYFAEDHEMDMIVMATHQRTGFAHLISGSIAEDVVNHAKRPVLTFGLKYIR